MKLLSNVFSIGKAIAVKSMSSFDFSKVIFNLASISEGPLYHLPAIALGELNKPEHDLSWVLWTMSTRIDNEYEMPSHILAGLSNGMY